MSWGCLPVEVVEAEAEAFHASVGVGEDVRYGPAGGGRGTEDVGSSAAVLAGFDGVDLADVAGSSSLAVVVAGLGLQGQLDDQVDVFGDGSRGVGLGDVRSGFEGAGDELVDGGSGVGGVGGGDGAFAGLDGLDQREDLAAADLSDDVALEVETE